MNPARGASRAAVLLVALMGSGLVACSTSAPPSGPPSASPTVTTPRPSPTGTKTIAGTAFYLESKNSNLVVHTVRGASDTTVTIPADSGLCPFNSAVISPAGDQVAWITTTDDLNGSGRLTMSDPSGANRRTLPPDIYCLGSTSLIWLDPGQMVVTLAPSGHRVLLDLTTGQSLAGEDTQGVWSDDGMWLATSDSSGNRVVMPKGNPGAARRYSYTPPADEAVHWDGWGVRSVSLDGRYVSVGWVGTDPSRHLESFAVVDTVTSKVVTLPVTGTVSSVHFLADHTVLVRLFGGQLVLLDQQFTVLDRTTEPASVRNLPLLRYVLSQD
jgi:hypothetical protein